MANKQSCHLTTKASVKRSVSSHRVQTEQNRMEHGPSDSCSRVRNALTSSEDPDDARAHTGVQASRERVFTPSTRTIFYSPLKFVISRSDLRIK